MILIKFVTKILNLGITSKYKRACLKGRLFKLIYYLNLLQYDFMRFGCAVSRINLQYINSNGQMAEIQHPANGSDLTVSCLTAAC
jgi:hypothetical protein